MNEAESVTAQLKMKVDELSAALLAAHPSMPQLLREIHKTVRQYPEQVTLLEAEEINKIVEGLSRQTGISLAGDMTKKGSSTNKISLAKIKSLGADAF